MSIIRDKETIKKYVDLAADKLKEAYAPYSNFPVSAILVTQDGNVFTGINVENVSYGATMCAERVAIYAAFSAGYRKDDFSCLFVRANTKAPIAPCSLCRQVFIEVFSSEMPIFLINEAGEYFVKNTADLVPYGFSSMEM